VKAVVVYKWARDPEDAAVRADGSIDWRGARMTAGEDDPAVLEVGRAIAGAGDTVVGLTIGDGDATWALARGIEQAVSVPDAAATADEASTAAILAAAVRSIGDVEMVVIGDAEAYPSVAPTLAGLLGWPVLLGVTGAAIEEGRVRASRRTGAMDQTLTLPLPAVLGVVAAGAEKQQPGMKEVLAARKRPVTAVPLASLDLAARAPIEMRGARVPQGGRARIFDGDPEVAAAQLVAALRADGVL
jgi:electron transfer flavoprotein beta subunit